MTARLARRIGCVLCAIAFFVTAPERISAQQRDPRIDALIMDAAQMKHTIAEQERRIAELEKAVQALQAKSVPAPDSLGCAGLASSGQLDPDQERDVGGGHRQSSGNSDHGSNRRRHPNAFLYARSAKHLHSSRQRHANG